MSYPASLAEVIEFFEFLPEAERRENLIHFADRAQTFRRKEGDHYELEDVRKDEECTDTVGVFLNANEHNQITFAIDLGDKVQTLTKAMTAILCQGLNGCRAEDILSVPADFVPRIVGAELVRLRSHTVYYVLSRMKTAVKMHLDQLKRASLLD
jgi:cysteine desulfuration protein SufE